MALEIAKILTLSTGHLREKTCNGYLPGEVVAYPKGPYGWFVAVPSVKDLEGREIPKELRAALGLARLNGCDWLCLDRDGEQVAALQFWEW